MVKTVATLFTDSDDAKSAAYDMRLAGFPDRDVSIVADVRRSRFERDATELDSADDATGAARGLLWGTAVGAVVGFAVTLLHIEFPGFEALLAAGNLAPTLLGAGIGAILGGLFGALKDLPARPITFGSHSKAVQRCAAMLTVSVDVSRVDEAEHIMRRHGGRDTKILSEAKSGDVCCP